MREVCGAISVIGIGFGLTALPSAAAGAVAFIDTEAVQLDLETGATAHVELFNGSPRAQTLTLRVLPVEGAEITVAPEATPATAEPSASLDRPGGKTAVFVVTVKDPPAAAANGELLATSSDGTSARLALRIGPQEAPPEVMPKELDLGAATAGAPVDMTVVQLPSVTEAETIGILYSSERDSATVKLEPGDKLRVESLDDSGTYKGEVDVNGTEDGGTTSLTVAVRDRFWLPLAILLGGILVGFVIEWWLTRLRPRALLDRRLGRLFERANQRRDRVDVALRRLFLNSRPENLPRPDDNAMWRVPQVAATIPEGINRCYLTRVGKEIEGALLHARTDAERELFGPDGDKYKALLADEDIYAELVGHLLEAAHIVDRDFKELRTTGEVPLRRWFDFECNGWVLGDKQTLEAHRDSAKALRTAAEHFASYRRRLRKAYALAGTDALKDKLEARRELLENTFVGDEGQVTWWDDHLSKLELELVQEPDPPDGEANGDPPELTVSPTPPSALTTHPPPPRPATASAQDPSAPEPPWDAEPGVLRRSLQFWEILIGAISLVIVAASGMSALYLANSTFGSTGDYVSLALWGSTATAGLALLRRLLPGALTTAQPGTGG